VENGWLASRSSVLTLVWDVIRSITFRGSARPLIGSMASILCRALRGIC
jgi:hypothetical protein